MVGMSVNMAQFQSVQVAVVLIPLFFGGASPLYVIGVSGAFLGSHNLFSTSCCLIARIFSTN